GGEFGVLLESAMPLILGCDITTDMRVRKDAFLCGESQSRIVVSVKSELQEQFLEFMANFDVEYSLLGTVNDGDLIIDGESFGEIEEVKDLYHNALHRILESETEAQA